MHGASVTPYAFWTPASSTTKISTHTFYEELTLLHGRRSILCPCIHPRSLTEWTCTQKWMSLGRAAMLPWCIDVAFIFRKQYSHAWPLRNASYKKHFLLYARYSSLVPLYTYRHLGLRTLCTDKGISVPVKRYFTVPRHFSSGRKWEFGQGKKIYYGHISPPHPPPWPL